MVDVNMDLATAGYLCTPAGEWRHIIDLERIMDDIASGQIHVAWAEPFSVRAAWFSPDTWTIHLAPWLVRCSPQFVRDVMAHELGHAVVGRSCDAARLWQSRYFRDIPPDW